MPLLWYSAWGANRVLMVNFSNGSSMRAIH